VTNYHKSNYKLSNDVSEVGYILPKLRNELADEEKAYQVLDNVVQVLREEHQVLNAGNVFKLESNLNAFQLKFPSRKIKARLEEAKNKDYILGQKAIEFVNSHLGVLSRSKAFNYAKADIFLCSKIWSGMHGKAIRERIYSLKITISKAETKIIKLKEEAIRQKRIKEAQDIKKAQYATSVDETRNLAQSIRRRLPTDQKCPYCDGPLGDNYHADHIYPVSKGGQSRESNMVNVCESCNIKKRNDTLNTFIKKYGLNRDSIERNLEKLGKEF